jgi:hypothetical protein
LITYSVISQAFIICTERQVWFSNCISGDWAPVIPVSPDDGHGAQRHVACPGFPSFHCHLATCFNNILMLTSTLCPMLGYIRWQMVCSL